MALFGQAKSSGVNADGAQLPVRPHALRPNLTVVFVSSKTAPRVFGASVLFLALCIPSAQISNGAIGLIVAALGFAGVFAWKTRGDDVVSIAIAPDDTINLRRRYEKAEYTIVLRTPIFVSPALICFGTHAHSTVALFADQTDVETWRVLRVRLRHLRAIQSAAGDGDASKIAM